VDECPFESVVTTRDVNVVRRLDGPAAVATWGEGVLFGGGVACDGDGVAEGVGEGEGEGEREGAAECVGEGVVGEELEAAVAEVDFELLEAAGTDGDADNGVDADAAGGLALLPATALGLGLEPAGADGCADEGAGPPDAGADAVTEPPADAPPDCPAALPAGEDALLAAISRRAQTLSRGARTSRRRRSRPARAASSSPSRWVVRSQSAVRLLGLCPWPRGPRRSLWSGFGAQR
jgi:hypothetical protein